MGLTEDSSYPWLLESLAYSYDDIGDRTRAIQYYEKAIKAYECTDDTESLGDSNSALAEIYAKKKDFKNAKTYFERTVELRKSRQDKNPGALAEAVSDLAHNFLQQGNYVEAQSNLNDLAVLAKEQQDSVLVNCLDSLGAIKELAKKKHQDAIATLAQDLHTRASKQ